MFTFAKLFIRHKTVAEKETQSSKQSNSTSIYLL